MSLRKERWHTNLKLLYSGGRSRLNLMFETSQVYIEFQDSQVYIQ